LRFSAEALRARLARLAGKQAAWLAIRLLDRYRPRLAFKLRARYAEWQSMGWFQHDLLSATSDIHPQSHPFKPQNQLPIER